MPRLVRLLRLCALALPLVVAACGSDSTSPDPTPVSTNPIPTIETATFAPGLNVNLAASTRTASGLYYRDLTVGTGTVAVAGMNVAAYYSGAFTDGRVFDSLAPPNQPYPFVLGTGNVIAGWHEGVAGMRVGGQRQLIIPPSLGYGSTVRIGIPANSILVFTVTLASAR